MRDMFLAAPGHKYVSADMDQLELRFAAGLARCRLYLDAFRAGLTDPTIDVHAISARLLFGKLFDSADPEKKKRMRDFTKRFVYASLYRAEPPTILEVLSSVEDDDGNLIYADVDLREARSRHRAWLSGAPEFEKWWETDLREWRRTGCLTEPVIGGRCDFLDGEEINKIANFKCQFGGKAIVHLSEIDLVAQIPFEKWGPGTGLILDGHDQLVFEVPEGEAVRTAAMMKEAMTHDGRKWGLDCTFTAKPEITDRWYEPKAKKPKVEGAVLLQ